MADGFAHLRLAIVLQGLCASLEDHYVKTRGPTEHDVLRHARHVGDPAWSTYELAKHVDRSLRPMWPRARSNLFNEPKKLVAHGLAVATEETVGRRPRTVYTITPAGRRALRQWLGTPGEGPVLEFEQLLKVFFADHGTKADVLKAVATIKQWAHDRNAENIAVARGYIAGTGPFPERAAVLTSSDASTPTSPTWSTHGLTGPPRPSTRGPTTPAAPNPTRAS